MGPGPLTHAGRDYAWRIRHHSPDLSPLRGGAINHPPTTHQAASRLSRSRAGECAVGVPGGPSGAPVAPRPRCPVQPPRLT
jgi:hypothetical protein